MQSLRFIDSNVFIHAFLKTSRKLEKHEENIKEGAKCIILRVEEGEEVTTTVVHISEVANILEARMSKDAKEILSTLTSLRNLTLIDVIGESYRTAIQTSELLNIGVNDTLVYNTMKVKGITEVYSFDKDFDGLPGIRRIAN